MLRVSEIYSATGAATYSKNSMRNEIQPKKFKRVRLSLFYELTLFGGFAGEGNVSV